MAYGIMLITVKLFKKSEVSLMKSPEKNGVDWHLVERLLGDWLDWQVIMRI
mgnify:CR=1 FL=1